MTDLRRFWLVTARPIGERPEPVLIGCYSDLADVNPPVFALPPGLPLLVRKGDLAHSATAGVFVASDGVIEGFEPVTDAHRTVADRAWLEHAPRERSPLPTPLLVMAADRPLPAECSELLITPDVRVVGT